MTNVVKLKPSRQFLIRQAVLNALAYHYVWGLKHFGAPELLRRIEGAGLLGLLAVEVGVQYRQLTGTYEEAPQLQPETDDYALTDPDFAAAVNAMGDFHS